MNRLLRNAIGAGSLATALATAFAVAPAAHAVVFGEASLDSGNAALQADYAYEPTMSANGDYVVFTGSLGGVQGVYRKDLATGALDIVAYGDAGAASVSEDGQYIAFTTTDATPGDPATVTGKACTSVYVRNMAVDPVAADPGHEPTIRATAFSLASAVTGSTTGLTYAGSSTSGCPGGGSATAPGASISGDGSKVVFTVVGESDLTTGISADTTTPGAQVAVRDLDTDTTTLVSQTSSSLGDTPIPVSGGAAMTDSSTGLGADAGTQPADVADSTASISQDGSTVAWLGINIPSQAAADPQDAPGGTSSAAGDYPQEYDEPLWRRIADGPSSPTRRILGADTPTCTSGCTGPLDLQWTGESPPPTATGPDRGSLLADDGFPYETAAGLEGGGGSLSLTDAVPSLSANGDEVAVISTQPPVGDIQSDGNIPCSPCQPELFSANAYVVNMAAGLTREEAVTPLTEWASYNFESDFADAGTVTGVTISPEGDEVAFVTRRTNFPLSPPTLITPQPTEAAYAQLYLADLADGTLQLVTTGYDDEPANDDVERPSFSDDSGPVAFATGATNIVYGAESDLTENGENVGTEVMTADQIVPTTTPGKTTIGKSPANPKSHPSWTISIRLRRKRSGEVILDAVVPGAGSLRASAVATVPTATTGATPTTRATQKVGRRAGTRSKRMVVASARATARREGSIVLELAPTARARRLIRREDGLYATVTVRFIARGHKAVKASAAIEFPRQSSRHRSHS